MTAFIGRREFLTLLGGSGCVAARGAGAAPGEAANDRLLGFEYGSDPEPMDRRFFATVARTRLD